MPRIAIPEVFHPRLQFRYMLFSSKLPGSVIYARSADQPTFDNSPVTVDFMSTYYKMKGKTKWQDIKLSCYQFEGITAREVYRYFNRDHMDVTDGVERFADEYKHMMQLYLLSPIGAILPTARWRLYGAFMAAASWGNMDYGLEDVVQCELTISYDYAEFKDATDVAGDLLNNGIDFIQGLF
tara:strand:- start:1979 stop:2524 length:546 start_codon:yes stop_codon:yes gene_type:complete